MKLTTAGGPARMRRRDFLNGAIAAGGLVAAGALRATGATEENPKRPNLIVIMADDLGAKELGCYGHPTHRTPNLDALARTGVRFKTCYTAPICHPTRFLIMTGQYGCHNGVYHFAGRPGGPGRDSREEKITSHVTFAQVLKKAGYATAMSGKWQLTGKIPTLVYETGFDEYCMWAYKHNLPGGVKHTGGWEGAKGGRTSRYWHPSIVKNAKYLPTKPDDYGPDIFTDFVIDFIRRHKSKAGGQADRPFFVYYPMALTHGPFYTTPDTTKTPGDRFRNRKENFRSNVEYMDKLVGRIVSALKELGLRDSTVVFFTGDNGTGGDGKGRPTELGARVPMIVNSPLWVKARGATDELTDTSDVLATLTEFGRAELPKDRPIDGRSIAPFLRGRTDKTREWIFAYLGDRRVLRTKRWLLENNSMKYFGRLYDCGDSRDGKGYKDVTGSTGPEVLAVKKRFGQILSGLPSPVLPTSAGAGGGGKVKRRPKGKGKASKAATKKP